MALITRKMKSEKLKKKKKFRSLLLTNLANLIACLLPWMLPPYKTTCNFLPLSCFLCDYMPLCKLYPRCLKWSLPQACPICLSVYCLTLLLQS